MCKKNKKMKKQKNKNKYTKRYYEQYALFALAECYEGFCLNKFKKEESPDWISEELNIGIEVVRAISKEEGEETSILQTFFGKGNNGQDIKLEVIRRYENTERKCLIDDIKLYNNIAYVTKDISFNSDFRNKKIDTIRAKILNKTKKLNYNYTKCSKNWLFVFVDIDVFENEVVSIIKSVIELESFENYYDEYFFATDDSLIIVDYTGSSRTIKISNDSLKRIKSKAFSDLF